MSDQDPIDTLARRASAALEDAARPRVAGAPEPDELRAVHGRRRMRQRAAAGVAVAGAVAVLVIAGTDLLPDRLELWIEDVVRQPDDAPEQSTDQAFEAPGSWTVETSLGTWTWTWIPEQDDAQALWADVDARFRAENELPNRSELADLVPVPDIPGMAWTTGSHWPFTPAEWIDPQYEQERPQVPWARSSGVTVGVVGAYGTVDWGSMYGNPEAYPRWDLSPGTVAVTLGWDEHPTAQLEFRLVPSDPAAVEFHDQQTGELVLRLEATDPTVSAAQLVAQGGHPAAGYHGSACWVLPGCTGVIWSLVVDTGDGFRPVDPPWRHLPLDLVDVTAGLDGFVAVGIGPADWPAGDRTPLLYRWGSTDGVAWHELGAPLRLPLAGRATRVRLAGDSGRLLMDLGVDEPEAIGDRTSLWTSTDGATWQRAAPNPNVASSPAERAAAMRLSLTAGGGLAPTGFGWVLYGGVGETWVSGDGQAWEMVPPPPDIATSSTRLDTISDSRLVGDALYARTSESHIRGEGEDVHRPIGLWIGQLDG
jgi:hypothetical protein